MHCNVAMHIAKCVLYNPSWYCCKHHNVCCEITFGIAANITMSTVKLPLIFAANITISVRRSSPSDWQKTGTEPGPGPQQTGLPVAVARLCYRLLDRLCTFTNFGNCLMTGLDRLGLVLYSTPSALSTPSTRLQASGP